MNEFLLETERLLLTPFALTDVEALHQLWTTPAVRKFLWDDQIIPHETVVEIVQASIQSFADQNFGFWTLRLKNQPDLIGFCGLRPMERSPNEIAEVEIFYGLQPEHWKQGLATEASKAVLGYGFGKAQLERIYAGADPPNEASFQVMKRLGMKFARHTTIPGLVSDAVADYYVISRAEFIATNSAIWSSALESN
jgi:RimJ/RimL family protein N-acetyltransferase